MGVVDESKQGNPQWSCYNQTLLISVYNNGCPVCMLRFLHFLCGRLVLELYRYKLSCMQLRVRMKYGCLFSWGGGEGRECEQSRREEGEEGKRNRPKTEVWNINRYKGRLTGRLRGRKEREEKGGGVSKHEHLSTASASVLEASLLAPRSSATVGWSSCSVSAVSSA